MTGLDKEKQIATLSSGKKIQYDALISTMPLDLTLTWLDKKQWADGLTHRYCRKQSHICTEFRAALPTPNTQHVKSAQSDQFHLHLTRRE